MTRTWCIIGLWLLAPTLVAGQRATGGVLVQTHRFSDESARLESITLRTAAFGISTPLLSWIRLSVDGAHADASLHLPNGLEARAEGPVDARVGVEARWGRFGIDALAVLPTGDVVSSFEEAALIGVLSSELLSSAVTQWGSGGGFGLGMGYRATIESANVTVTAGYVTLRQSALFEAGTFAYRPASEIRARALIEAPLGDASVLSVLTGVQLYGRDDYAARPVFEPGARIEGLVSLGFPLGAREGAMLYGGVYHLGSGTLAVIEQLPPSDVALPGLADTSSRQLLLAGGEIRIDRGRFALAPRGEMRLLRRGDGLGQGWTASAGSRAQYRLMGGERGRRMAVEPSFALRLGRVTPHADATAGVLGWEAGVALRWEGGR